MDFISIELILNKMFQGYRPWGNQKNDIAVAKLAGKPVTVTDYVRPVCLPTFVPPVGDKLIITGWGGTENVGNSNIKLKEIALPLASQQLCAEQWGGLYHLPSESLSWFAHDFDR